jgi:predicted deacylase
VQIGTASANPGEKSFGFLKVTTRPDGTDVGINVAIVNGSKTGLVLLVDGLHHGNEYAGYEAILRLAKELDPKELKGTFIGVPVLNLEAFQARARVSPKDAQDMNRIYPGREFGTATEQIVFAYLGQIVPKANYIISCHGSADQRSPLTYVVCPAWEESETLRKSAELARAFGFEIIDRHEKLYSTGYLPKWSVEKGIPTILVESGGLTDTYENRWHYVDLVVKGIKNVMKHLGMIEGRPDLPRKQFIVRIEELCCKYGGRWIPDVKGSPQKPGAQKEIARKGATLGRIMDPLIIDREIERIEAPYDGMVVGIYYHPVVHPGDHLIYFGKILQETENT